MNKLPGTSALFIVHSDISHPFLHLRAPPSLQLAALYLEETLYQTINLLPLKKKINLPDIPVETSSSFSYTLRIWISRMYDESVRWLTSFRIATRDDASSSSLS